MIYDMFNHKVVPGNVVIVKGRRALVLQIVACVPRPYHTALAVKSEVDVDHYIKVVYEGQRRNNGVNTPTGKWNGNVVRISRFDRIILER